MRILLVKTSSLGDVIHNLPVVSDIRQHLPDAKIDWCVEESCADIPRLHPAVDTIIPVALRRWRKRLFNRQTWQEIGTFRHQLQTQTYDWVIDSQGLVKSALITRLANGNSAGYTADTAREPFAARAFVANFFVPISLHAVERNRRLVSAVLGYSVSPELDYGITAPPLDNKTFAAAMPYVVFLSATSRDDKLWPEMHWIELGKQLYTAGLKIILPSGSPRERERAERIAAQIPEAIAAPALNIMSLASLLSCAQAVVGVDTGLTHLAAALKKPTIALYTATDPGLTGVVSSGRFRNLGNKNCSPNVDEALSTGQALAAWSLG